MKTQQRLKNRNEFHNQGFKRFVMLIFGMLTLFAIACNSNKTIYEKTTDIKNNSWNVNESIAFETAIYDTLTAYNLYINVRNTGLYQYSNLFLFVKTDAPNGATVTDTLNYMLANPAGKWLGKGWGDVWSNEIPFRLNVRFPVKGIYTISIKHGMRDEELSAILDVGMLIEEVEQ